MTNALLTENASDMLHKVHKHSPTVCCERGLEMGSWVKMFLAQKSFNANSPNETNDWGGLTFDT